MVYAVESTGILYAINGSSEIIDGEAVLMVSNWNVSLGDPEYPDANQVSRGSIRGWSPLRSPFFSFLSQA
jgi:hypothetical protein